MNSHKFIQTLKPDIKYCKNCGCLSYKNTTGSSLLCQKDSSFKTDPLTLKYHPVSFKLNYDLPSHQIYITHRIIGISAINNTINNFGFNKIISYKAIGLMDQIYLSNEINIENIEKIAYMYIIKCSVQ